jgi:putative membrane protein
MFIQSLIISSAILAAPHAQNPPPATPETPRPAAGAPAPRADQAPKDHAVPATDVAFVRKAAEGGMHEVAIAKLGQEKAEHADVKAFAAKLEKDHTQANTELTSLAESKHITLAASGKPNAVHARLEKLSGAEFDRAFVAAMVDDHQKDVKAFEKAASGAKDADVKAFAAKTLPTLKEHLTQVQALAKQVGKKPMS